MTNVILPNIDPNNPNPMGVPSPAEQQVILDYIGIARGRALQRILEIGTYQGYTTKLMADNFPDMMVVTVDLPPGKLGVIPDLECERLTYWSEHSQLTGDEPNIWRVECDSALYRAGYFGVIFIDGAHSYEYALADSLTALKSIESNGIILWHDYAPVYADTVVRVVDMLAKTYPIKAIPGTKLAVLDMKEENHAPHYNSHPPHPPTS